MVEYGIVNVYVYVYVMIYAPRNRFEVVPWIYEVHTISFQTFFRMGTFIDSTHMKL